MATNLKISQLLSATTPLGNGDLIPLVQKDPNTSNWLTRQTTLGDLKNSVLSGISATGLKYTGGQTAIQTTASQIDVYDVSGNSLMVFDPTYSTMALHSQSTDGTVSSNFILNEKGFNFTRTQTANGVTGVSQIRLNSNDVYLLSNKNINLLSGAPTGNTGTTLHDLGNSGSINLLAGKDLSCASNGLLSISSNKEIDIINTDADDRETLSTSGTITYYQAHTYHDSITIHDGLAYSNTRQTVLSNYDSSTKVTTITNDSTEIYNSITMNGDGMIVKTSVMDIYVDNTFNVRNSSGTVIFSDATITNLSSTVNTLNSTVSTLNSSLTSLKLATSYTVTYAMTSVLPANTQVSSQLVANVNGALTIGGVAATVGQYFFTNLETASPQYAFNGVCRVDQVGSASAPWKISLYDKPYIVEVSATSSLTGIYVKSTAAGTTNTVYKKM
ncbi:MAG: hypothetical protein P4L28_11985 [Paludibacteraceae bacterium]|nr:hypothetical protein [Paludibacteraceae bacterium]